MSEPTANHSANHSASRLRHTVRGFVGHTESLGRGFRAVAESLAAQPTVDPDGWGSAYADDPWPRPLPVDLPDATRARLRQHYLAQRPERVRSLTFVTRVSGSWVTLADYEGALVLTLDYCPDGDSAPLHDLPTDLPADLRTAVQGLQFTQAATLQAQLVAPSATRPPAGDRVTLLLGLAALWHDDLRLAETLSRIARLKADDWALRAAGIAVAQREGYALLLHELWAGETDAELHAELTALLTDAQPSPADEAGA